eukprot:scaffold24032_cov49-Attheya_sp.AAC.6
MAMTRSRRPNHHYHHHRRPTIFEIIVGTIIVVTVSTCHNVGTTGIGIRSCEALALPLVTVRVARLPEDLKQIQACRRTAVYGDDCDSTTNTNTNTNANTNNEKGLLDSQRSFLNADQIQTKNGSYQCLIAVEEETNRVVGTADLNIRRGLVNNVYVQDRIRGRGIGTRLMQGVECELIYQRSKKDSSTNHQNNDDNNNQKPTTLRLTVETTNAPAVALYKRLGFQTPGVHALTAAISSATGLTLLIEMTKQL